MAELQILDLDLLPIPEITFNFNFKTIEVTNNQGQISTFPSRLQYLTEMSFGQMYLTDTQRTYLSTFYSAHAGRKIPFLCKNLCEYKLIRRKPDPTQQVESFTILYPIAGSNNLKFQIFKVYRVGDRLAYKTIRYPDLNTFRIIHGTRAIDFTFDPIDATVNFTTQPPAKRIIKGEFYLKYRFENPSLDITNIVREGCLKHTVSGITIREIHEKTNQPLFELENITGL